jgi:hypothetical protein
MTMDQETVRQASDPSFRYTVVDSDGTVSFNGPAHILKMLVAACAEGARTVMELLDHLEPYDEQAADYVRHGLRRFDEHNVADETDHFDRLLAELPPAELPPFRVYDDASQQAASRPGRLGLVIFNLAERRIVQVQNSYAEIERRDRGRIRRAGKPQRRYYSYELPGEWSLVP